MGTNSGTMPFTDRVPKRVTFAATGATDLVAAVTGRKIRVTALVVSNNQAGNVVFQSASTNIGTIVAKTADPTTVLPDNPNGWMETASGEKLAVTPSAGTATGFLVYIEM